MAVSQNGYVGIESYSDSRLVSNPLVPGTNVKILGGLLRSTAPVLLYVASRFHREVEALQQDLGQWGYNYRPIRGASTLSNHSSGTAIDLNAVRHPLGASGTFSSEQRAAIRRILNDCGGLIRWGGDYSGRKDEMHFEVNGNTSQLAELARRISTGLSPDPAPPAPAPDPTPAPLPTPTDWWTTVDEGTAKRLIKEAVAEVIGDTANRVNWLYTNEQLEGYGYSKTAANFNDTRGIPGAVMSSLVGDRTVAYLLAAMAQTLGIQVFGVTEDGRTMYGVVAGDTFSEIAKKFNVTQDALKAANPEIKDVNDIAIGQVLVIPKA